MKLFKNRFQTYDSFKLDQTMVKNFVKYTSIALLFGISFPLNAQVENISLISSETMIQFEIKMGAENEDLYRLELYNLGYSDIQIAEKTGLTSKGVRDWRVSRNLTPNEYDRSISESDEALRLELYCKGLGDKALGKIIGLTDVGVKGWRDKRGLPPNNNDRQNRCLRSLQVLDECEYQNKI